MKVLLIGADNVRSAVEISENATVRDVATGKYHLILADHEKKWGRGLSIYYKSFRWR